MARRPIWRGHLRLALVSSPVALYPARHEQGNLHFHLINPDTSHRIRMVAQDAETEAPVSRGDLVKGYEFKKDYYLIMTDEDFESARVESSSTLNVAKFVELGSIDPVYYDASYYVAPDGKTGKDVYVVLRDAIASTGRVALARVTIDGRERAIAISPYGGGMIAHTLNEERDLNSPKELFDDLEGIESDPEMVKLAKQLIDRQTGQYDPANVDDRYEARLRKVIEAKLKGEGIEPMEEEPDRSNVIDLMSALRQSLGRTNGKAEKKPTASKKMATRSKTPMRKTAKKTVRKRA